MRLSSLALGLAALAVASAIDGRLPCDRGVLLEKAGVKTLQTCLATSNLTLDTLDKAHAAALCAVPACVSVVTMASTTTTCPNGQEYAGLCDAATPTATTGPATTSSMTALPTSSAASTTGAPKTPAVAPSSASAVSLATVVAVTSAILLVKDT